MKKSQLKAIIKEEIKNVVKEDYRKDYASYKSKWKALETALKAYKNELKRLNSASGMPQIKDIERQLVNLNVEADELVSTYGYGE